MEAWSGLSMAGCHIDGLCDYCCAEFGIVEILMVDDDNGKIILDERRGGPLT